VPIVVQGEVESDSVRWQAGRRGEDAIRSTGALAIGGPVVTPFLVPFRIAFGGRFASGAMAHVAFVDPSGAGVGAVVGRIGRDSIFAVADSAEIVGGHWVGARLDSVRAWRVALGGPAPAVLWVDRQGQVVDGFTSEGLRLRRTAFELATAAYHPRTRAGGAPGAMSARLAGALLAPPPSRARLALLLQPAAGDSVWRLGVLAEGRQRLSGDTLVVTHELPGDSAMQPTWTLPYGDSARAAELEASLLAPVTDPQIAARARAIVGAERRPVEAARRLVRWTASLSRDSLGEGWPDARRTLDRRRGDAASHAALFVTAARSVGLPARLVAGAVEHGGRWSMHTWAEVWLGDWVPADPTYGPFPTGASYLRLSVGVPARPLQIVPLFARLDPRPLSSNGIR
jgi:transglutaminase-like putative cysteine protease